MTVAHPAHPAHPHTVTKAGAPTMAWALSHSSSARARVTDAQLGELDDYELACRAGPGARDALLETRRAAIAHALVCAAGAQNSRAQMLRAVTALHAILARAAPPALHDAVVGLARLHAAHPPPAPPGGAASFLHPLVSIAVTRVADTQLSAVAAHALAHILGCPALDGARGGAAEERDRRRREGEQLPQTSETRDGRGEEEPPYHPSPEILAAVEEHTTRLIASLLTELSLSDSPHALAALSTLLRRDGARRAFCAKDGVSALSTALRAIPASAARGAGNDPVEAAYNAVFAVWMLSFARGAEARQTVLRDAVAARLPVALADVLADSRGHRQRLKVARVALAALANLAVGDSALHARFRRDLLAAGVPAALARLRALTARRGSLLGADEDARHDAELLCDELAREAGRMSTVDAYAAEVRAGALRDSPVHADAAFWATHSERIVAELPDVLPALADVVCDDTAAPLACAIACADLANLMRCAAAARRFAARRDGLKARLIALVASAKDARLRGAALLCVQVLMLQRSVRVNQVAPR